MILSPGIVAGCHATLCWRRFASPRQDLSKHYQSWSLLMLVLDEQLAWRNLEPVLKRWYHGPVLLITDLRPSTIVKDDAVPMLLRQQNQPTFITINVRDFWHQEMI